MTTNDNGEKFKFNCNWVVMFTGTVTYVAVNVNFILDCRYVT